MPIFFKTIDRTGKEVLINVQMINFIKYFNEDKIAEITMGRYVVMLNTPQYEQLCNFLCTIIPE